jgi:hypothetical protein
MKNATPDTTTTMKNATPDTTTTMKNYVTGVVDKT